MTTSVDEKLRIHFTDLSAEASGSADYHCQELNRILYDVPEDAKQMWGIGGSPEVLSHFLHLIASVAKYAPYDLERVDRLLHWIQFACQDAKAWVEDARGMR